jgi:hypothetical protein
MYQTFRIRPFYRDIGLICVAIWSAFGVVAAWAAMTDPKIAHPLAALLLFGAISSFFNGLGVWLLLAYWKYRLIIEDHHLTKIGIFATRELRLVDVTEAHWRLRPVGGGILLATPDVRMKLDFNEYTTEQRDALIRHFRAELDPSVQEGWKLFAYRVSDGEPTGREPHPGDVLVTRRRADLIGSAATLAAAGIGMFRAWQVGKWWFALGPPGFMFAVWMFLRFSTPKQGQIDRRISAMDWPPGLIRILLSLLPFVGFIELISWLRLAPTSETVAMSSGLAIYVIYVMTEAYFGDRWQRRRDVQAAEAAAIARGEQPSTGDAFRL